MLLTLFLFFKADCPADWLGAERNELDADRGAEDAAVTVAEVEREREETHGGGKKRGGLDSKGE